MQDVWLLAAPVAERVLMLPGFEGLNRPKHICKVLYKSYEFSEFRFFNYGFRGFCFIAGLHTICKSSLEVVTVHRAPFEDW